MSLTVIILTFQEEKHIARAIASVRDIATDILVVDSGSTDQTTKLANELGAKVLHHSWTNYATQFNWALDQLPEDTEWVLRLDADEIITKDLAAEIKEKLRTLPAKTHGVYASRRMHFLDRRIEWGGVFPVRVLRLFRHGHGRCENRWMDEHIIVEGQTVEFLGEIIDDNLNSLTWWTEKHNAYASREVVDLLNLEYGFMPHETVADLKDGQQAGVKRWLKEKIYARLPGGLRVAVYFFYRYILRLGFLDGKEGTAFHVLQGFWYRYLVDAKLFETRAYMKRHNVDALTAIHDVFGIHIDPNEVD